MKMIDPKYAKDIIGTHIWISSREGQNLKHVSIRIIVTSLFVLGQFLYISCSASTSDKVKGEYISLAQPRSLPHIKAIPGATIHRSNFDSEEVSRLAKEGILIGSNSFGQQINLISGNVLISPDKDTIISAAGAEIQLAAGSSAFIVNNTDGLTIYDLHQTRAKQIAIKFAGNKFIVEPGQLLILTKHNVVDFQTLKTNCRRVPYTNAKSAVSAEAPMNIFLGQFSLIAALVNIAPLKHVIQSNNIQDKKLLDRLVRDAVMLGSNTDELYISNK